VWWGVMNEVRANPKLHAVVESHPNVEKHDVRMGHPAHDDIFNFVTLPAV